MENAREMKYRKKPVEIEAIQWLGDNTEEVITFCEGKAHYIPRSCYLEIDTLEGQMRAVPGNFIVRGVKGEYYPCRGDIFEETYERVDE
jgi:hypothetical protein